MKAVERIILSLAISGLTACVSHSPIGTSKLSLAPSTERDVIQTSQGSIRGKVENSTYVFRGIPFAKSPVGDLRWRQPQEPEPFDKLFEAKDFGPVCPQMVLDADVIIVQPPENQSEDCLTLNIWVPKSKEANELPVMVWLHGGWSVRGAGSLPVYDGRILAEEQNVIVVTINYRLGPFGFMAHPKLSEEAKIRGIGLTSGNYGILDQIQALKWLQKNIRAFGGDPSRVTVFGQSAGAASTLVLLASPLNQGLFSRAIILSGRFRSNHALLSEKERQGLKLSRRIGCNGSNELECLRGKTTNEVLGVVGKSATYGNGSHFEANIDGYLLSAPLTKIFAEGKQARVPIIIGATWDEASRYLPSVSVSDISSLKKFIEKNWGNTGNLALRIAETYVPTRDEDAREQLDRIFTDSRYICSMRRFSRILSQQGVPVYSYLFGYVSPAGRKRNLGAYHGSELPYLFGNFDRLRSVKFENQDYALSKVMRGHFSAFAASGVPQASGVVRWPSGSSEKESIFWFDVAPQIKTGFRQSECEIWDKVEVSKAQIQEKEAGAN